MPDLELRKFATVVEEIYHEGGPPAGEPLLRAAALAVIRNPFAGRYEPEIQWFMEKLKPLGLDMAQRLAKAVGGAERVEGYGKGALIGAAGELEHAAALLHPRLGAPLRAAVARGAALVPSSKKMGGPGQSLDVPLGHKEAAYVRSHFDGVEVRLNDAPRADEIMVAVAVTDSGRPLPRVGGLRAAEVVGEDGLR